MLDEQLEGRQLDNAIKKWYGGAVGNLSDLRFGTIIKDDAIPQLLRKQRKRKPAFLTINVSDFWRKVPIEEDFCVICFNLPDKDIMRIPGLLRQLYRHRRFNSRERRAGHVFRINADGRIRYYSRSHQQIRSLIW